MENTTFTRKIDELGRIVIPRDFREKLGFADKSDIRIQMVDDTLVLSAANPSCAICGNTCELKPIRGKHICNSCAESL